MKFTPHNYQKTAIEWLITHPEAALFLDPGLGKTSIALTAVKAMRAAKKSRVLVVAPLRVAQMVWSQDGEVGKWDDFADLKVHLLHGDNRYVPDKHPDIYVINFDGLSWLIMCDSCEGDGKIGIADESGFVKRITCGMCKGTGVGKRLEQLGCDTLIIDELSKLKHTKSKRFHAIKKVLGTFKRRWGLTGSPASNGLLDLFGQVYCLDQGKALGKFVTHYKNKYFQSVGYMGYQYVPKHGAEKDIYKALEPLALSMKAQDHLDLPEMVERNIWVNLPPSARKTYDKLEQDLIAYINDEAVTAANAATASMKCRQVASGGVYSDAIPGEKRRTISIHDAKTEALSDIVDELQGSPLLIAYEFEHDLERIRKALGKETPAINGSTSMLESQRLIAAWNLGELPFLCGQPMAMSHGLNLQACGHHICWYSTTWDFELYDQLIRRVWRQGQKNRVMVHRILARKTVDEAIIKALSSKKRGQDALFAALKELKR